MGTVKQALLLLGITAALTLAAAVFHPKRPPWRLVDDRASAAAAQLTPEDVAKLQKPITIITTDSQIEGDLTLTLANWEHDLFDAFQTLQELSGGSLVVTGPDREAIAGRLEELLGLGNVFVAAE